MNKSTRYILVVCIIVLISVVGILHIQHQTGILENFQQEFDINQFDKDQSALDNNTFLKAYYYHAKSAENLNDKNNQLEDSLAKNTYGEKVNTFDKSVNTLHDASTQYIKVNRNDYEKINDMSSDIKTKIYSAANEIQNRKKTLFEDKVNAVNTVLNTDTYASVLNASVQNVRANSDKTIENALANNTRIQQDIEQAYNNNLQNTNTILSSPIVSDMLNNSVVVPYVNSRVEEAVSTVANPSEPKNGVIISVYSIYGQKLVSYQSNNINFVASNENDTLFAYRINNTPMTTKSLDLRMMIAFEGYILVPTGTTRLRLQVCSSYLKHVAWSVNTTDASRTNKNAFTKFIAWSKDIRNERISTNNQPFGASFLNNDTPSQICYNTDDVTVKSGDKIYYRFVMLQRRAGENNYFGYEKNSDFFIASWAKNGGSFEEISAGSLFITDKSLRQLEYDTTDTSINTRTDIIQARSGSRYGSDLTLSEYSAMRSNPDYFKTTSGDADFANYMRVPSNRLYWCKANSGVDCTGKSNDCYNRC